jgi:hypothetical protein
MLIIYTEDMYVLAVLSSITNRLWTEKATCSRITVFLIVIANFVVVLNLPDVNGALLCDVILMRI